MVQGLRAPSVLPEVIDLIPAPTFDALQVSAPPVPDPMPSTVLLGHCTQMVHHNLSRQNHMHIKEKLKIQSVYTWL